MTETKQPANVYCLPLNELDAIPGDPWVYWITPSIRSAFKRFVKLEIVAQPKAGTGTGDNFRFLRYWWEVSRTNINRDFSNSIQATETTEKWYPYMKGGKLCKWYGNQEFVINWKNKANELKNYDRAVIRNEDYYFRIGITWTDLGTKGFSGRLSPGGFVYDVSGSCFFPNSPEKIFYFLGLVNGEPVNYLLNLINPIIHFQVGDLARLPIPIKYDSNFEKKVVFVIWISIFLSTNDETTYDYVYPFFHLELEDVNKKLLTLEKEIDEYVYDLYQFSYEDQDFIKRELLGNSSSNDEEIFPEEDYTQNAITENGIDIHSWLSYAVGIVLGRFRPGIPSALGSAIYHRSDFAIGSMPEPSEEEFDQLVGSTKKFAYYDPQGGRHVFPEKVEKDLQTLALSDGIAILDEDHVNDLTTRVGKALERMLGEQGARKVIEQGAGGNLRSFLNKDYFTQYHLRWYRKRPVYWYIQSTKRSYGFAIFHEKIDKNTFYTIQQEPYLATKRRSVQLRLEEIQKDLLQTQGSARKNLENELDSLRQLAEELAEFARNLEAITSGGYEPEPNWIDDGIILRMAPLWPVIPLWKNEPKKYWEALQDGKYDWSHIAMHYWPERVREKCRQDKSFALAHGHEEWYQGR